MSPRERAARPPVGQSEPPRAGVSPHTKIWVASRGSIVGHPGTSPFRPLALGAAALPARMLFLTRKDRLNQFPHVTRHDPRNPSKRIPTTECPGNRGRYSAMFLRVGYMRS